MKLSLPGTRIAQQRMTQLIVFKSVRMSYSSWNFVLSGLL